LKEEIPQSCRIFCSDDLAPRENFYKLICALLVNRFPGSTPFFRSDLVPKYYIISAAQKKSIMSPSLKIIDSPDTLGHGICVNMVKISCVFA
jgi:hypothetical protein